MKNIILSTVVIAMVLVSCNKKNKEGEPSTPPMIMSDSTMTATDSTKVYACPMHPEVQGKLNDKCSKCGMKLTEEVK
jgi:nitrous oxide reductase accessory protein NosL